MSKHTPGPWRVEGPDDDPYGQIGVFASGPSRCVCELWQDDAPDRDYNAEQWSNARLIAAAPELYDALKRVTDELATYVDGCDHSVNICECSAIQAGQDARLLLRRIDVDQP